MTKILNTFTAKPEKPTYYEVSRELYRNGDYAAYRGPVSIVYAYKTVAFSERVGLWKELIDWLATENRPSDEVHGFYFDAAIEIRDRGIALLDAMTPSMGPRKIPLLVGKGQAGGGEICGSIVRIRYADSDRDLYRHPNYHSGKIEVVEDASVSGYTHAILIAGQLYSRHKTQKSAHMLAAKLL